MIDKKGFTFYPKAWLSDEKLSRCSLRAKGMWIDLLCHMHDGDPYGYLIFNNKILNENEIRKLLRITNIEAFDSAWEELFENEIIQKDHTNGAFYSKRMKVEHKNQEEKLKDPSKSPHYELAKEVIEHLNIVSGKNFPLDNYSYNLIESWCEKGYKAKDFKIVNEVKNSEWKDSDAMSGYIRPSTLYGDKFINYLNQIPNYQLKHSSASRNWKFDHYYSTQPNVQKKD